MKKGTFSKLALVLSMLVGYSWASAQGDAELMLMPSTTQAVQGDEFTVDVVLKNPNQEKGRRERTSMRYYETLYIINPDLPEDGYREVVTKFTDLVEKNKGVVTKVDEWGIKTLAYAVKKFKRGSYVLLQYCGEPGITAELKREMSLDDRLLKYQTIKLSDNADPEALTAEGNEGQEEVEETAETAEETSAENEGENGI